MHIKRYLIITIFITVILFGVTIYSFFSSLIKTYTTTNNEIKGLEKVETLSTLNRKLQRLRTLSLFEAGTPDYPRIKQQIASARKSIEELASQLPDSLYKKEIETFLERSFEQFYPYTGLINKTSHAILESARIDKLLFEPDPSLYFMVELVVTYIPETVENLSKIESETLESIIYNKFTSEQTSHINRAYENYTKAHEHSVYYLNHIKSNYQEAVNLYAKLKEEKHKVLEYQKQLLIEGKSLVADTYLNEMSLLIESHISVEKQIIDELLKGFEIRKKQTLFDIFLSLLFFIFTIMIAVGYYYFNLTAKKRRADHKKIEQYKNYTIESLKETLFRENDYETLCHKILEFYTEEFKAANAVLYLYDQTNNELKLAAASGISVYDIAHFIPLDQGTIGQCFQSQKFLITDLPDDVIINTNLMQIRPRQIWTIPLIHFDDSVAIIQLSFLRPSSIDQEHLDYINEICALHIHKLQKDEEGRALLSIVNQNVITSSTNKNGIITYVSDAFATISGYSKEELIGKKHNILRHPDMEDSLFAQMWETITQGRTWNGEIKNTVKNGGEYWVDITISADLDFFGNILGYTAIRQNITDKKKIEEISITDSLTGIYNRRYFESIFERDFNLAKREKKNLIFILIDIDHFKQYNDTYGHQEGDSALISVAHTLNSMLKRPDDYAFRIGGEEFGLLYNAISLDDAVKFAQSIREGVEKLHIDHKGNSASSYLTISMGMFFFNGEKSSSKLQVNEIYKYADASLYKAKEFGRNRLEIWEQ